MANIQETNRNKTPPRNGKRKFIETGLGVLPTMVSSDDPCSENSSVRSTDPTPPRKVRTVQSNSRDGSPSGNRIQQHECQLISTSSDEDVNEGIPGTTDVRRHRNYTFNFPLVQFENMETYYIDLWTRNCKYIIFQKESKY